MRNCSQHHPEAGDFIRKRAARNEAAHLCIHSEVDGAPAPWAKTTRGAPSFPGDPSLRFVRQRFDGGGAAAMEAEPLKT